MPVAHVRPRRPDPGDVLNGIADRPGPGTCLILGKPWPKRIEVRFGHSEALLPIAVT